MPGSKVRTHISEGGYRRERENLARVRANYDDRGGPLDWGVYQGEKDDVIDWIDTNHPDFRDQLEGRKHPTVELREVKPTVVNRQAVEELWAALQQKAQADARLEAARLP